VRKSSFERESALRVRVHGRPRAASGRRPSGGTLGHAPVDTRGTLDYLRRREARAMITGLYIDHFKTFQNFEWKPGRSRC